MKQSINTLLFDNTTFSETAFQTDSGKYIAPGDQFHANSRNIANVAKHLPLQYVTVSRIGQACEQTPNFVLKGYDINECAYGTLFAVGEEVKWRCDGNTLWTTLSIDGDESFLSNQELYRLFLYPFVAWYENQNDEIKSFREKYQKRQATMDDCLLFCSAFQYGFVPAHSEVEVIDGCSESLCEPARDKNIVVTTNGNMSMNNASALPWQCQNEIPNNLSIQSAIAKKYHLGGHWDTVCEGNQSYDFKPDMIDPAILHDYVDNPDFRDTLQQLIGYIGSVFRTNHLEWDGTCMNTFLQERNVNMTHSIQQNIMLAGEPGSGKTLLCRALAASLGIPCLIIRLGERSEKDELTQEVIATDKGFQTLRSRMYWYVKYGGLIVFDDLANADPNLFFSVTGGLFESPYEYVVNQETVKRHPLCIMMATTNVGTVGSLPITEAALTRFGGHYVISRLEDETFKKCIIERAQSNSGVTVKPSTQTAIANWTFNVFNSVTKAVKTVDRESADRLITMRAAISTAEKMLNALADGFVVDGKKAACQTMANILYTGGNPVLQKAVSDAIDSAPSLTV